MKAMLWQGLPHVLNANQPDVQMLLLPQPAERKLRCISSTGSSISTAHKLLLNTACKNVPVDMEIYYCSPRHPLRAPLWSN